ncbi:MAG TPA: HEAT repeat domain-containing protein [Polyangiaceae bacterium LLY-WYZ-15_(1-7)]|nr:HEAT repeat domain-containing protein [Polyangiaceae bacterium LLY-WYZ-15_(1-7)]
MIRPLAFALCLALCLARAPSAALAQPASARSASAQVAQPAETLRLGRAFSLRIVAEEGALHLRAPGLDAPLPALEAPTLAARVIEQGRHRLGLVEVRAGERHLAFLVRARGPRLELLWRGRLDAHGDLGERRRDVLLEEDRTGDGEPDLIVGWVSEARAICGQEETLLEPRALDPRSGALRPVSLRPLPAPEGQALAPTPDEAEAPLLPALQARASSSTAGSPADLAPPPLALVDGDPATAWVEGRAGSGRWEFATLRWSAADFPIRALGLRLATTENVAAPREVWLVHEGGAFAVTLPEDAAPGSAWRLTLPEPLRTRCLSLVFAEGPGPHTGLAELRAYTALDEGGGLDALVGRLAHAGDEGAAAARLLAEIGGPALTLLRERWLDMPPAEKRRALPVFIRHAGTPVAREALVGAALDADEEVRAATLEALEAGGESMRPILVDLVPSPEIGDRAATLLARRAPELALGPILEALGGEGGSERPALREALRAALRRGAPIDAVAAWLDDAPPIPSRAAAALALAQAGEEAAPLAARAVEGALRAPEEDFPSRWRLVEAAARLPASGPTDAWLAGLARSADAWMLRAAAIRALAARGAEGARAAARRGLGDETPRVRQAAIRALAELGIEGDDVERVAILGRRDGWPLVRASGLRALEEVERARPVVRAAVRDRSRHVRAAAIDTLRDAGDAEAWPRIRERMEDDDEWPLVTRAGVAYVRARCLEEGIPALGAVLERALVANPWLPEIEAAAEAVEALAAIGGAAAEPWLERAASDLAPAAVRQAAEQRGRAEGCARRSPERR